MAYLTRPRLVGRKTLVAWARERQPVACSSDKGGTVVIEGDPGVGRTRALDACVAEVKRVGGRGRPSHREPRRQPRLRGRRHALSPADARAARKCRALGAQERAILAPVLAELRRPGDPERPMERRHVQAAFRDWLLGLARHHRVLLAVDDIESVDEPSAALLGMLAHDIERRSLLIVVTRTAGSGEGLAVDVLTRLGVELPARGAVGVGDRRAGSQRVR